MSEPANRAVFLSYASQDAEASRRICDALRAAGVEVWFDAEGGLEHGDEWDAKIRRQIKECVLFIAVISANTQAREEGYFRLEWELAAQRALSIAGGVAFILPVIIDSTKEAQALVPDRFRAVQWTRLAGGAISPEVLSRLLKLWSHRTGTLKGAEASAARPPVELPEVASAPAKRPRVASSLVALGIGAVVAGGWWVLRPAPVTPIQTSSTPAVVVPAPASEARQLAAKASALVRALEATREDYALAEEYSQRALKLDPDDAEAWAATSQVSSAYSYRGWDTAPARREQARVAAERAMKLAPKSVNARMVQAGTWAAYNINRDEREKLLREIVQEHPDNQEALRFLAVTVLLRPDGLEECLAFNERSAALPGGDPLALFNNARYLWMRGRSTEGYETVQRALAQKSFPSALVLKMAMEISRGEFAAANATFTKIPPGGRQEDRANYQAGLLHYHQGKAAEALEIWRAFPRDYYVDFTFEGPKGLLIGLADELDHRDVAAKIEWQAALQLVEKRIAAAPNNSTAYLAQAWLLACLGEKVAANEALRTHEQLARIKYSAEQPMSFSLARVYVRLGRLDEVFANPPTGGVGILRSSPDFAPLRTDPRFERLVNQGEAPPNASVRSAIPEKSVAVLAFANLSDDKANEYFSDGISEELLNVLAKVPKLKVAARTSSFYFKGKEVPIPEIAQKLGVAYVVEGSVRKAGNKVRITAQLIKAADGFHVWSETYDRDLIDIFAVQDEIAKNILGVVKGSLMGEADLPHTTTTKIEAYTLFLQGQGAFARRGVAGLEEAIRLFEAALAIDPNYVPALAGLAQARVLVPIYANLSGAKAADMVAAARKAAQRVLALDPRNATAHVVLGWAMVQVDWRWSEGLELMLRARELAPNDAWIWNSLGDYYRFVGDLRQSLAAKRREWELDPLSFVSHWDLAYSYQVVEDYDQTIHWAELAIRLAPHNLDSYIPAILIAAQTGRLEKMRTLLAAARREVHENEGMLLLLEARGAIAENKRAEALRILTKVVPLAESGDSTPAYLGYLYLLLGESKPAALWLQQGYERHDGAIVWPEYIDFDVIAANPATRPILDQPGLKELYELRQRHARAGLNKL